MGKVADCATSSLDGELEPRAFWAPDFKVMINVSQEAGPMGVKPTTLLCEINERSEIIWDVTGLQVAGLASKEKAAAEVLRFRRRRQ